MKKIIGLLFILGMGIGIGRGQTPPPYNYQISQQPLPPVTNVFANYTGTTGQTTYFYWIIARYGVGNSAPSPARQVNSIGTGSVSIGWSAPAQPTGYALAYDILRTTNGQFPGSCTACLVSGNQTTLSVTDSLGVLGNYTSNTYNSANPVNVTVDNLNDTTVKIVGSSPFTPFSGGNVGTITSVTCGTGLSGGVITSTGTCAVLGVPFATPAVTHTLVGNYDIFVCTTTCTITVPVPTGAPNTQQFCVMNDDNVSTVITLSAIGSSAMYENQARTAYGTAGTGTLVSSGAIGDQVCILGRDSTHYLTVSSNGVWTTN